jgi:hypothetical protein
MTTPSTNSVVAPLTSTVSLGPDLPITVYHAAEPWHPERVGALALYCSDGRWGEAFDEFCHKHLRIPRYDRWAVPGGPAWLASGDNPALLEAARVQLDFLVRLHELEQVVLITHYGCAAYAHRLGRSPDDCLPAQAEDIRTAARTLRRWHPQLGVTAFLAMRRDRCLSFHELDCGK